MLRCLLRDAATPPLLGCRAFRDAAIDAMTFY